MTFDESKTVVIRTTEVGSCPRKRQWNLSSPRDALGGFVQPVQDHLYPIRGWLSHYHIQQFVNAKQDYFPDPPVPETLRAEHNIPHSLDKILEEQVRHDWGNFEKWLKKTDVSLAPENVVGAEYQIIMPVSPPRGVTLSYALRMDVDLLLKGDIIDFKSGKKSYLRSYTWQLGAYRRGARYLQLHRDSPTGDFRLRDVFLGDDEPEERILDRKKLDASMMHFDKALSDTILNDFLCRTDSRYEAPCEVDIYCAFCRWRGFCRGF
jgi:hypothetical protein